MQQVPLMTRLAVTGASGKTGWRVVQEALSRGYQVRALLRPQSEVPEGLTGAEIQRLELGDAEPSARPWKAATLWSLPPGRVPLWMCWAP